MGAVVCGLAIAACTGSVPVDAPDPAHATDAAACAELVEALPETVWDAERRPVDPEDAYAAAWGDPPIVLRCGVPRPAELTAASSCYEINGLGWLFPTGPVEGDVAVFTTIGRSPYVEVRVPLEHDPPSTALVDVGAAILSTTEEIAPCV